ncbi:MAG: hypothetical protein H0W44_05585 [Gammaproteobacteria bacterium]|nr:hypothetical protein [Gammaproteobacteria bacterium]
MKSDVDKLLIKNPALTHSTDQKVVSHVQREIDEWIMNTVMIENWQVPFKFKRKKRYKNLQGARVNLTYYPQTELIGGLEFETMKVVRIRIA